MTFFLVIEENLNLKIQIEMVLTIVEDYYQPHLSFHGNTRILHALELHVDQ